MTVCVFASRKVFVFFVVVENLNFSFLREIIVGLAVHSNRWGRASTVFFSTPFSCIKWLSSFKFILFLKFSLFSKALKLSDFETLKPEHFLIFSRHKVTFYSTIKQQFNCYKKKKAPLSECNVEEILLPDLTQGLFKISCSF